MQNRRQFLKATVLVAAPFVHTGPAAARSMRLTISHNNGLSTAADVTAVAMQKHILRHGNGGLAAEVFPLSMLGNEMQMAQALVDGTLACSIIPIGPLARYAEEASLVEYPFLLPNLKLARSSLDGNLGAFVRGKLESKGLIVLSWAENGIRHMTANKPIRTPSDLKGLKLRVQPIKIHLEVFKALGAAAAPMAWTDLPSALRAGVFEAQENPINNVAVSDFIVATQSHLSLTAHVYSPSVIVFSKDVWGRLSAAQRDIVAEAATAGTAACRRFNDESEEASRKKLIAAGMKIVTDVDTAAFQRAIEQLGSDVSRHYNAEALAAMRKLVA